MRIRNRPIYTETFDRPDDFSPEADSVFVYGLSDEERSLQSQNWRSSNPEVKFVEIVGEADVFKFADSSEEAKVSLRSTQQLRDFWRGHERRFYYVDITGLEHRVWMPLIRSAIQLGIAIRVLYREPGDYKFSAGPSEGNIFDLSEELQGVSPIPGFTTLDDADDSAGHFISLLGFEGTRFSLMLEQMQPDHEKLIPIVGVPGFRPEFPKFAYIGNQIALEGTGAWLKTRFVRANCPFSMVYELEDIATETGADTMRIALIGTKPHALGAMLFAMLTPRLVELVYDHPVRKEKRTSGVARMLLYHVTALFSGIEG